MNANDLSMLNTNIKTGYNFNKKKLEYGAITEQGDLGLGFNILNEADQEIMRRNKEKEDRGY